MKRVMVRYGIRAQVRKSLCGYSMGTFIVTGSYRTEIHVVKGPAGKYLRTDRDNTTRNNFDDLIECKSTIACNIYLE